MSIRVVCPLCNAKIKAPDSAAGKEVKCPRCATQIMIPTSMAVVVLPPPVVTKPNPSASPFDNTDGDEKPAKKPRRNNRTEEEPYDEPRREQSQPTASGAAHSLGIASLILGVLGFILSLVPCIGMLSLPISALGLLLGLVGGTVSLVRSGRGIGFPIAGSFLNAFAIGIAFIWVIAAASIGEIGKQDKMPNQVVETNVNKGDDKSVTKKTKTEDEGADDSTPKGDNKTATKKTKTEDEWADASTSFAKQGDIRVRITGAKIGRVELTDIGKLGTKSKDELLQVSLTIENLSETKLVSYRGWGSVDFGTQPGLTDNFGNVYKTIGFGIFNHPISQIKQTDIYPGKTVSDIIVFSLPVQNTQHLRLKLPARNFQGNGELRFQIPKNMYASD